MIFVYALIYMDFISELVFFMQNSVQISAVSLGHSREVWIQSGKLVEVHWGLVIDSYAWGNAMLH